MRFYLEALFRLVYPASCGVCHAALEIDEDGLCRECRRALAAIRFSPVKAIVPDRFRFLDSAWALYPYEFPARELLCAMKFFKKRWLARSFEQDLSPLAGAVAAENFYDHLIPVPIDRWRYAEREFNQSELIAGQFSRCTGIPVASHLLVKKRKNNAQSLLSKKERPLNVYRAFRLRGPGKIKNKRFLLVDDILTTGATAEEAARLLKEHGAQRVDLFAVARALAPGGGNTPNGERSQP